MKLSPEYQLLQDEWVNELLIKLGQVYQKHYKLTKKGNKIIIANKIILTVKYKVSKQENILSKNFMCKKPISKGV